MRERCDWKWAQAEWLGALAELRLTADQTYRVRKSPDAICTLCPTIEVVKLYFPQHTPVVGVDAKHSYRFGYLQSDHWKNLRLEKLVQQKARCQICGIENFHNDVHHRIYRRNLYDANLNDLMVMCRECHDAAHSVDTNGIKGWKRSRMQLAAAKRRIPKNTDKPKILHPSPEELSFRRAIGRGRRALHKAAGERNRKCYFLIIRSFRLATREAVLDLF